MSRSPTRTTEPPAGPPGRTGRDPDLALLQAFAAVAHHRSFRRAAAALGVSVSGLSQRVRDLEEGLGVRLLNRTTRSVAPTEAGEQLLGRLEPALREVADAVDELRRRRDEPSGRLRINAPAPAIHLVLAPMAAAFLKRFPQVVLEIVAEPSLIDIVRDGFDAGVRFDEDLAQDMIAVPLGGPQRYAVAAAPALVAGRGRPAHPEDLLGQPLLAVRLPGRAVMAWEFEKDGRRVRIVPDGPLMSSDPALLLHAAIDGLGFLATFEGYVRAEVAAGRLTTVLDDWCAEFSGPFLYYPSRRQPPPALAAFIAFVAEWRRRPSQDCL